ncbi:hypothetical protein H6P81_016247 [Aristolochia fimbriata]|uniref:Gag-pol polyprotein n=1 Tax=Aristolochia fimbriata TaxID=158543 RepID=A0AAV7E7T2_ARIFI|nr:hypothetical protein H6P81_016247 [Aristolochia fimbriata]
MEQTSSEWNDVEDKLSNCNSKALNAYFGGIDEEQFRRVSTCTTAKEAWKILEVHYEGTESVSAVKLQMLMTQFELMRMTDEETILEFEGKSKDIANQSAHLGDKIPQDRLVKKMNEESSDSVRENKRESVALQTFASNEVTQSTQESDILTITLTELDAKVSFLAKGLNRFIRKSKKKNYSEGAGKPSGGGFDSANKSKNISCYECGGRGHIQSECPTYLKTKKSFVMTVVLWKMKNFNAKYKASQSDDEIDDEDDIGTVENIIKQWDGVLQSTKVLREQVVVLEREQVVVLEREKVVLKQKLDEKEEEVRETERKEGSTELLTNLQKENGGQVIIGDGAKGSVVGKGDLNVQGLPKLKNMLLVDGLKANLISISQLCDQNMYVKFTKDGCKVMDEENISVLEGTRTCDNCYKLILSHQCQYTKENTAQLWNKRLGHIRSRGLQKLIKYGAVRGLPALIGTVETVCKGCMEGKQHRDPHPALKIFTTKQPLELLHMAESIARKKYVMVCVDDFTRFTWVEFLREKSKAFKLFMNLCKQRMTKKGVTIGRIVRIRSDHGKEFENLDFANFCASKGISLEFSAPKTLQQNGNVERKNSTLQEMPRTMINGKELPHKLWAEAVNTACYVSNRLRKFHSRSMEGIFVGYSRNSHAYRVFLKNENIVIETVKVADQTESLQMSDDEQEHVPLIQKEGTVSTVIDTPECAPEDTGVSSTEIQESGTTKEKTPSIRVQKNHPADAIIGDVNEGGKVTLEYLSTENQLADIFTKSLGAK